VVNDIQDFVLTFSSILWEAMPFIVLGALIAGILEELLPQQLIGRIMPRYAVPAVMLGGMLGLVFPMCECGIVVVMRRLLRKGLPLAVCIAYMLAGPIVNLVVLLSTYVAFFPHGIGVEMVALRAGLGFVIACVTGLVVYLLEKRTGTAALLKPLALPPAARTTGAGEDGAPAPKKSAFRRLANISETALHDFVDITVFLILGAALAAMVKMYVGPEQIGTFSSDYPHLSIPAMMMLAVVLCLCSEADAFVAASFTKMSVSSKLAFLVLGPMLDIKLILMWTRVFRTKLILVIVACTVLQSGAYTMLVHQVYDPDPRALGAGQTVAPTAAEPSQPEAAQEQPAPDHEPK
jgi:uncharacterized membrane protein YraQ (UPF0718 family)